MLARGWHASTATSIGWLVASGSHRAKGHSILKAALEVPPIRSAEVGRVVPPASAFVGQNLPLANDRF
jgi:hypothetical protein